MAIHASIIPHDNMDQRATQKRDGRDKRGVDNSLGHQTLHFISFQALCLGCLGHDLHSQPGPRSVYQAATAGQTALDSVNAVDNLADALTANTDRHSGEQGSTERDVVMAAPMRCAKNGPCTLHAGAWTISEEYADLDIRFGPSPCAMWHELDMWICQACSTMHTRG